MFSMADSKRNEQKEKQVESKTKSQEEGFQKWKEHFKNLLGNPSKITDKPMEKIINCQLDIKVRQFMEEELDNT